MLVAIDTETELISGCNVIPKMVCIQFATRDGKEIETDVMLATDPGAMQVFEALLDDDEVDFTGANTAFDMAVCLRQWPHLSPKIWEAYERGRVFDVTLMAKLHCISTAGDWPPSESFSLASLEKSWIGVDRSEDKEGEDVWRLRYSELAEVPVEEWPEDALRYAQDDVIGTLMVHEEIEGTAEKEGYGSINTAAFQAAAGFALIFATARGMKVDPERVKVLEQALEDRLNPDKMQPLYDAGLLCPAEPPQPYANGAVDKETGLPKMKKAKPEKKNMSAIRQMVEEACAEYDLEIPETDKGATQTNADIMNTLRLHGHELAAKLSDREEVIKLKTTYLPVLQNKWGVVHFGFNTLVTSGRTSSFGSKLYPSTNGQNQPRLGGDLSVRECFEAREGYVLCSVDFDGLELCSTGHVTKSLFGDSVHHEKNHAGVDFHAYLGSQLAATLDPEFSKLVEDRGLDQEEVYEAFQAWKDDPELKKTWKHFRTFAKPTGLGYPGGLGPQTFIEFARTTYGVVVDEATARTLREVWFRTYPEMRQYFRWVNAQHDPKNAGKHAYHSPMGMYRAGCTYTAAANGMAMQTPSGEGAKISVFRVAREMFDPSRESILRSCYLVDFIHDELLVEIPEDDLAHERAMRIADVMVDSMSLILTEARISAQPALMRRWYKQAEPVYDENGRLQVWEPQP